MVNRKPINKNKSFRYKILGAILVGAVVLGILYSSRTDFTFSKREAATGNANGRDLIINSIVIGAVAKEEVALKNPQVITKNYYGAGQPLGMKITTDPDRKEAVEIHARLLKPAGQIIELDPPVITFEPGNNTFCCWMPTEMGEFSLQLFRPEKVITTIPLVIKEAPKMPTGNVKIF